MRLAGGKDEPLPPGAGIRAPWSSHRRVHAWKQGEVGASNRPTVGFTKNPVSNPTGERREDAEGAPALISLKDLVEPTGKSQEAAWAGNAREAGGGFGEFALPRAAELNPPYFRRFMS